MRSTVLLTSFLACVSAGACVSAQEPALVISTARFDLRSDARTALHHFLIAWASADVGEWPPYARPLEERERWRSELSEEEQDGWTDAVDAYGAAVGRSLLFDDALLSVRDWTVGEQPRSAIPADEQRLADALDDALPIYLEHWWPAHDQRNREWIEALAPTLASVEEEAIARLEAAYGGRWIDTRVPVDVMVYANPVGAYSVSGRLTMSSADRGLQMPQAVEMVFHEASHMDPLEGPLRSGLDRAYAAIDATPPDRLWHDIIFFTSGEVVRLIFAERGMPEYRHYGSFGVYLRGERWAAELPAFEAHWAPYLESRASDVERRQAALEGFARALTGGAALR